jgi:hypothetical protein
MNRSVGSESWVAEYTFCEAVMEVSRLSFRADRENGASLIVPSNPWDIMHSDVHVFRFESIAGFPITFVRVGHLL